MAQQVQAISFLQFWKKKRHNWFHVSQRVHVAVKSDFKRTNNIITFCPVACFAHGGLLSGYNVPLE